MQADIDTQRAALEVEVLPENWHAALVFLGMATQWRRDFGEPTGLDYSVLHVVMAEHKATPRRRPYAELMGQLRVLEDEALGQFNLSRVH